MDRDPELRQRGIDTMSEVYGWEMTDGEGDFFAYTADHLFADIWNRPGLSTRDRRLLLIGLLTGANHHDVTPIQLGAAHGNGELDAQALREIVIFLSHYAGWPAGARMFSQVEKVIGDAARAEAAAAAEAAAEQG